MPQNIVSAVERMLEAGDERARRAASEGFERLSSRQQPLATYMAGKLSPRLDDKALALGHTLAVAIFMAFEELATEPLRCLTSEVVAAMDAALGADEELRRAEPVDCLESEDIVAMEQPALVALVNDYVGRTLSRYADSIDVDDVSVVFRVLLVQILALSHAVARPPGYPVGQGEEPMA